MRTSISYLIAGFGLAVLAGIIPARAENKVMSIQELSRLPNFQSVEGYTFPKSMQGMPAIEFFNEKWKARGITQKDLQDAKKICRKIDRNKYQLISVGCSGVDNIIYG